ncbi:PTPRA-like protein [Mya arenaria]|uniref:protein-tyrosine-phosphatase n=1 Tax=Mya arenaria TaxID=6604 RepID=A0ABY7FVC3_MYAAR|nr:PTPRA-like protein [Mya arenaria]
MKCNTPGIITNGYYDSRKTAYQYGDTIYVNCGRGYKLKGGGGTRICSENGTWSGIIPECVIVTCRKPSRFVNGYYTLEYQTQKLLKEEYNFNTTVVPHCDLGYYLRHSYVRSCDSTGNWKGIEPNCKRIQCPVTNTSDHFHKFSANHTSVSTKFIDVNTSVYLECRTGFHSTTSQNMQTCLLNGSLSGRKPRCSKMACVSSVGQVERVVSGIHLTVVGPIKYNENRNVSVNDSLFLHEGGDLTVNCAANGSLVWGIAGPPSVRPVCPLITPTNGWTNHTCVTKNRCEVGKSVNITCKRGYTAAHGIATCMPDHTWSNGLYCEEEMEIQFKNFPKGLTNDYNEALNDATRVILQKDEQHSTNYINASFIHGYSLAKEFVAAQGPTDEILVDFWRMVWQLRVGKIVMLTNLEEDKKMKCVQYWPGEGSIEYDSFKITHRSAELFSDFVIRKLALQKDGEEERIVYHFQFTAWPDKSVPKYASSLVHFRQKIVTTAVKDKGPIIVHCSAGVGRTGTFIALNVLTEQTSTVGYVDPVGCVNSLRRQRLDMEQYIFLHMALLETLMLSTSDLPASKFMKAYEELLVFDKHRRKLDVEFSRLEKMSPVADECQNVSAKEMRNKNKNRYSNILPVADNMPYLTPSGNRSDPDYINAVFLPEDEIYWPENEESKTYENMTITKTGEESERGLRIIRLDLNRFGKTRKLQQIQFEGWPDDSTLPSSPKGFINLLDAVQYWQHQSGNNPVLVHCMNGSESGLFCVVSAVLERMKIEQDVAITQVIKEMRNYREQVIPSVDQFKFVHEVVKEYILQNETYSNFAARC